MKKKSILYYYYYFVALVELVPFIENTVTSRRSRSLAWLCWKTKIKRDCGVESGAKHRTPRTTRLKRVELNQECGVITPEYVLL